MLIPLQCETLSHRGVGQLLDTVHDVRRFTNRDLEVWGVLPTLYDGRTNHARTVLETICDTYDLEVIEPPIPKTIKFAEAPAAGRSILATSAQQQGGEGLPRGRAANLVERARRPRAKRKGRTSEPAPRHPAAAALRRGWERPARRSRSPWSRCSAGSGCSRCRRARRTRPATRPRASRPTTAQPTSADPVSDAGATTPKTKSQGNGTSADATESQVDPQLDAALPEGSGTGKRVVFSEGRQRVWLVNEDEQVERTYLVSGSVYDNLEPGTFNVYSRSEQAWGVDDSGSMKYFVRFTQGDTGPPSASTTSRSRTACPSRPAAARHAAVATAASVSGAPTRSRSGSSRRSARPSIVTA